MSRTRVKICGVRDVETALYCAECGADAVGLMFYEGSVRNVEPEVAEEIVAYLPPFVTSVGVFVNAKVDAYEGALAAVGFDVGQLHGREAEPTVRACGRTGEWGGRGVIKAIRFDGETIEADLMKWGRVSEVCAVLVDGSAGGEGTTLDWEKLAAVQEASDHPIVLAGGLTSENVGEAIRVVRPWAVDVSSGVESEKGEKDAGKIAEFCAAVREADRARSG